MPLFNRVGILETADKRSGEIQIPTLITNKYLIHAKPASSSRISSSSFDHASHYAFKFLRFKNLNKQTVF